MGKNCAQLEADLFLYWYERDFIFKNRKAKRFNFMPTEEAYSSWHLVLSHFWTWKSSNIETNLSRTCLVSGILVLNFPQYFCFAP